jgi:hypothetical protein
MAFAMAGMQLDVGQEALRVLGVVGQDIGTELDFALRLADALAHLQRHYVRGMVDPVMQQLCSLVHNLRAFGIARPPPCFEAGGCDRDLLLKFLVGDLLEGLDEFVVKRG